MSLLKKYIEFKRFSENKLRRLVIFLFIALLFSCQEEQIERMPPEVEFIIPTSGIKGTAVTIFGRGFSKNAAVINVLFGDKPGEIILSNAESILVKVPGGATTGNVIVKIEGHETTGPLFTYQQSGEVSDFAGNGFEGLENGDADISRFTLPWGTALDGDGNIYVADRGNHLIRKITPQGVVSTLAGTGQAGYMDGTAAQAKFDDPVDTAIDEAGNIYVSDFGNHCIRKITPSGDVSTYAGLAGVFGNTNGTLLNARFFGPAGMAFDSQGNLFIADFFNHRIRKITPAGIVSTLAGSSAGCTDGTGVAAQFNAPVGLTSDADNNIYVADGLNHSIRKVTPSGIVTRIAGTCTAGFEDGTLVTAKFNTPIGVSVDLKGDIVVTDAANNCLRKIYVNENKVLTVAGSGTAGKINGIGEEASFNAPADLVLTGASEFLLVDFGNNKIRKTVID